VVERVGKKHGVRYLHVAAHGEKGALAGAGGQSIARAIIRNAIRAATSGNGASLKGVYFGSCDFGNMIDMNFLLSPDDNTTRKLVWIAGYDKSPNWIDAAVVEMFFWHRFRRLSRLAEVQRVVKLAEQIGTFTPGASEKLGFDIFVRRKGKGGGIRGIIRDTLKADEIA
jgi:hypothetical protein